MKMIIKPVPGNRKIIFGPHQGIVTVRKIFLIVKMFAAVIYLVWVNLNVLEVVKSFQ